MADVAERTPARTPGSTQSGRRARPTNERGLCPAYRADLVTLSLSWGDSWVVVEECSGCGLVAFDPHELEAVAQIVKSLAKPDIHPRRTVGGEEIDFVVERGRRLLPVEVKSRGAARVADAAGIDSFCREHGASRAPFGLVLHGGREASRFTRHAIAVPLGAMI